MSRLFCGCLSTKKHKSFPINEKQHDYEGNKIFIKHVENIRRTPPPPPPPPVLSPQPNKKTIAKTSKFVQENATIAPGQTSIFKLFQKPKVSEENNEKTSSSWSTSSNTNRQKTPIKPRLHIESYNIPQKKTSDDMKSPGKSKLVLENVRKMIKDQQKESVQL